jgi:non-specific serine/threonine protein kinase
MTAVGVPAGPLAPVFGRRAELAELRRRLPTDRLVTLTGEPGCGTSTLAVAAAAEFTRSHHERVHHVVVADLETADVAHAVAAAAELSLGAAPTDEGVARALEDRAALLVLDGCEQHVDACASLVDAVLTHAPSVRVLTTSRRVLGVRGEAVLRIGALSLPPDTSPRAEQALASEAVALFVDRATEARRTFRITDDNAPAVAAICTLLEGNPLAVVLAATRVGALSPEDLLRRLEDAFRVLTKAPQDSPDRHRSLQASVELSHGLCTPEEQLLWARMSVFAGSIDLEGVEQVCSGDGIEEHDVLDLVDGLLEKGVLLRDESDPAQVRYRMPGVLRAYGAVRLDEDETRRLQDRNLDAARHRVVSAVQQWFGPHQVEISRRLRAERANLRAALVHAEQDGRDRELAELAAGLAPLWVVSGDLEEGRTWLDHAAARAIPDRLLLRVELVATWLAVLQGDNVQGRLRLDEARRLAPDPGLGAAAIERLDGALAGLEGRFDDAETLLRQAIESAVLHDDTQAAATGWYLLACARWMAGRAEDAVEAAVEARALTAAAQESHLRARALSLLSVAALEAGDLERAEALARDALRLHVSLGDEGSVTATVDQLVWVAAARGDLDRAAALLGVLDRRSRTHHRPVEVTAVRDPAVRRRTAEQAVVQVLGRRRLDTRRQEGAEMTDEAAVRFALEGLESRPDPSDEAEHLTPRELAVAELVGRGLSNRDIGAELGISERTAQGHVQNILRKLGFTSRTQVAAWVADRNARGRVDV